jgi:hypothetical protein
VIGWFSRDADDCFDLHDTANEAKAAAEAALKWCREEASGEEGWPEDTRRICWGEVCEAAKPRVIHAHDAECRDEEGRLDCDYADWDETWEYDLTPPAADDSGAEGREGGTMDDYGYVESRDRDPEVVAVQALIDGLRARLASAEARVDGPSDRRTGRGSAQKERRWARGEERRLVVEWLRAQKSDALPRVADALARAADEIEAGRHRPEGPNGVPTDAERRVAAALESVRWKPVQVAWIIASVREIVRYQRALYIDVDPRLRAGPSYNSGAVDALDEVERRIIAALVPAGAAPEATSDDLAYQRGVLAALDVLGARWRLAEEERRAHAATDRWEAPTAAEEALEGACSEVAALVGVPSPSEESDKYAHRSRRTLGGADGAT